MKLTELARKNAQTKEEEDQANDGPILQQAALQEKA